MTTKKCSKTTDQTTTPIQRNLQTDFTKLKLCKTWITARPIKSWVVTVRKLELHKYHSSGTLLKLSRHLTWQRVGDIQILRYTSVGCYFASPKENYHVLLLRTTDLTTRNMLKKFVLKFTAELQSYSSCTFNTMNHLFTKSY